MELRPYQEAMIEAARQEFRAGHRRVLLVAPCGAGKTVLSAFMAQRHVKGGGRVLFLAHRRELLSQAADTFTRAGLGAREAVSASEIRIGTGITIASIQGLARRAGRMEIPTLIILDEAHHAGAASWRAALDAFPEARAVGLTATPVRLDGRGLGDVFDCMAGGGLPAGHRPSPGGGLPAGGQPLAGHRSSAGGGLPAGGQPLAGHRSSAGGVTARWLIENGYLADYRYFAPETVDTGTLRVARGDFRPGDMEALFSARGAGVIMGDVIRHYRRLADGRQAICYCPTRALSRDFAARFRAAGIAAEHMDGDMPRAARDAAVERFRAGETRILCNVDLLGEGFDVPDCGCAILLRPTASLSLYIQQAMRPLRPRPGKVAVIIDHVGNITRHGLPDEEREWSLTGRQRRRDAAAPASTRTCPACFAVLPASAAVCPYCGQAFEMRPRDAPEEDAGAELTEVDKARARREKRKEEGMARTYEELKALAAQRGYKPGWAWHRARARGLV